MSRKRPFADACTVRQLVERNPSLFASEKAAYEFIARNRAELVKAGAIIRLGSGPRAPLRVMEPQLLEVCRRWAQEDVSCWARA